MRWSDERILTTHTGSLPRPPELTRLYVRRARGEAIEHKEVIEVADVFDSVYAAATSQWSRFLHFSGVSRFDQEFLIRLDDEALPALEHAVSR